MNDQHHDNTNPLHLGTDPQLAEIESLLDAMGQADRDSMPERVRTQTLEAISRVYAPAPIAIDRADELQEHQPQATGRSVMWKLRIAAALTLTTAVALSLVATKPWVGPAPAPADQGPLATKVTQKPAWNLVSFEQDLDAYLALEEVGDDALDDAVANWELWAQTIDTDFDTELLGSGIGLTDLTDGAL